MQRPSAWLRIVRVTFAAYAIALALGTHWPQLSVDVGIPRTDIWLHIGAFCGWTVLCIACSFFGPWHTSRNITRAAMLAVAYAAIDESTQAIPILHRHVGFDDFLANVAGVLSAVLLAGGIARHAGKSSPVPGDQRPRSAGVTGRDNDTNQASSTALRGQE